MSNLGAVVVALPMAPVFVIVSQHHHLLHLLLLLLLFLLQFGVEQSEGQQSYVDNKQLDCDQNATTTLGFLCNGASTSCQSFLTFRSTSTYNTPVTIAYLLASDASLITAANNISSDVAPLPIDTLILVPVNCSCTSISNNNYYQHNASYVLKAQGETYFNVANDTYQALTTCQSMEAQNPFNFRRLSPGLTLTVPLRCACPTPNQTAAGFNYLLTYLIRQGNTVESIARAFSGAGAGIQSILDANELTVDHLIYFFTPILVPLKTQPTKDNINTMASPPLPPPIAPPLIPPPPQTIAGGCSPEWALESRFWLYLHLDLRLIGSSSYGVAEKSLRPRL